jgi:mannose/fructose/N-acetylgalactosamine-specific phosphotransferase system component IID
MTHEFNLFGVYLAPFAGDLLRATVVFFILRALLARLRLSGRVWHPALFELCLFVLVFSATVYLT